MENIPYLFHLVGFFFKLQIYGRCGQNFCLKILYHKEGTNIVYTAIYWSLILGLGAKNFVA